MQSLENDNVSKFSDKFDWFSKLYFFDKPNNDAFNFFIKDPIYKNYISQYYFLSQEHVENIEAFRIEATKSYFAITKLLRLQGEVASEATSFIVKKDVLHCYEGTYSLKSGETCEILLEDNSLFLIWYSNKIELISLSPTKFTAKSVLFKFNETNNGDVSGLIWHQAGQLLHFTKKKRLTSVNRK